MKKTIFYIVTLFTILWQPVYGNTDAIKKANELYAAGNYSEAAQAYENIIAQISPHGFQYFFVELICFPAQRW